MVKTHKKIVLGHSFLQGVWTRKEQMNENEDPLNASFNSRAMTMPDRRLSVCHGGCVTKKTDAGTDRGRQSGDERGTNRGDDRDGLLGSMLVDSFLGAAFGPLLPVWASSMDWMLLAEGIDTVWLERREAADRAYRSAQTPGISQVFVPL